MRVVSLRSGAASAARDAGLSMRLIHSLAAIAGIALASIATEARAERIKNPTAIFSGLDKITGKIISFDVAIDETVQFGALQVTPRVCYSRSASENPQTTSFIEVDEITLQKTSKRIFTGWMFADSPGLHAVEHPVYDVWLTECKGGKPTEEPPPAASTAEVKPKRNKRDDAETQVEEPAPAEPDFFDVPIDPTLPVD
jgi:hypothetical protein